MANILFICDMEEGHLIPSFGLAHSLKGRGHNVSYLSILDNEEMVRDQGFEFHYILENIYPKGLRKKIKDLQTNKLNPLLSSVESLISPILVKKNHVHQVISGAYEEFLSHAKVDLIVICFYVPFDILVLYYKYKFKPVIYSPVIHEKETTIEGEIIRFLVELDPDDQCMFLDLLSESEVDYSTFEEIAEPLGKLHQLILCPSDFKMNIEPSRYIHFIEPSLRKASLETDIYEMYKIPANKKIVYAAMGSQALRHRTTCDKFFGKVISIMQLPEFSHLHLLLSVDAQYDRNKLGAIPSNVTILSWAPQIDILRVASVAIIHGGLGSVKECIYYGVPMIVFPQGFDQPANARRVVYHKMGFADNILSVTEEDLRYYLQQALENPEIREGVTRMKKIFQDKEKEEAGANIIENLLKQNAMKMI